MAVDVPSRHRCMIYDGSPSRALPALVAAIRSNLDAEMRCLYINSPSMVAGFHSLLYTTGIDVEHEIGRGALVLDSSDEHLVAGKFTVDRMIELLDDAVVAAIADGYKGLFATGDMTWEFGPEKEFEKLVEYEWRLEQLFHKHPELSGICQYHRDLLPPEAVRRAIVSHGTVFIGDTITRLNPHYVAARSPTERMLAARPDLDDAIDALLAFKG